MKTRKLVALLILYPVILHAQQPLVGTWQVHFQAGMKIEDGEATPIFANGTLAVQPVADSLIGTLTTDPRPTCRRGRRCGSRRRRAPAKPRSSRTPGQPST